MKCNHFTKLSTITSKNKIFMSTSTSFLSMSFQIFILFLAESNFALIIVKNNFTIYENFLLPEALYFRSWQGRKARSLSFTCQRLMEETKPKVTGDWEACPKGTAGAGNLLTCQHTNDCNET